MHPQPHEFHRVLDCTHAADFWNLKSSSLRTSRSTEAAACGRTLVDQIDTDSWREVAGREDCGH